MFVILVSIFVKIPWDIYVRNGFPFIYLSVSGFIFIHLKFVKFRQCLLSYRATVLQKCGLRFINPFKNFKRLLTLSYEFMVPFDASYSVTAKLVESG